MLVPLPEIEARRNPTCQVHLRQRRAIEPLAFAASCSRRSDSVGSSGHGFNRRSWPSSRLEASLLRASSREENLKPGSTDWQLTRVRPDGNGFRSPWIEGYCSKQSVRAGETHRHHGLDRSAAQVPGRDLPHGLLRRPGGSPAANHRACSMGQAQPVPEPGAKNLRECRWKPSLQPDDSTRLAERRLSRQADDAG